MAATPTVEVFVNYRTLDARYGAAAVHELLSARFGTDRVFRDCVSMLPGADYPDAIRLALEQARLLVVLVGPEWFATGDDGARLVDDERDWVRREIRRAFERGIPVVPVLLDGVAPPAAADLPDDIAGLARCQAAPVDHRALGRDVASLADRITRLVPELVLPDLFEPAPSLPDQPLPSMLLRAEYGVVPFVGREAELARLRDWLAAPDRTLGHLVTGPAGQGKTRLAAEVAAMARADGWAAGFLPEVVPDDVLAGVERFRVPLLLVVDYAEGRTEQLAALAAALAERPPGHGPARLLLLARSAGLWQSYLRPRDDRAALLFTDLPELRLGPLTAAVDRHGEFDRAVLAFRAARAESEAGTVAAPLDLDDPRYERALDIHAVALAACLDLDAARPGPSQGDPVARVLDHEERYWLGTTETYHLAEPHLGRLRQVVSAATLFGAPDTGAARALLAALPTFDGEARDRVERYRRWLAELYPGEAALNPLRPDRLGEDLVAMVLRHEPELALAGAPDDTQLVRALTVLGRSAARHGHLRTVLSDLLTVEPASRLPIGMAVATQLADDTLVSVLNDLDDDIDHDSDGGLDGDPDLADIVVASLPEQSLALAVFAAVRTRAALDRERSRPVPNEETLAWLAIRMSVRLTALCQLDDALTYAVEAVRRYRELAADPAFAPDLANALNTLAGAFDAMGLYDDALAAADDSVTRLRELSATDPGLREILATALMTRGNILGGLARHDEAVAALTEAVAVNRALLAEHPDELPVGLAYGCALSLENLSSALADAGRLEESLDAAERAFEVTRLLAVQDADRFGPDEIRCAVNLSASYGQLDRWPTARQVAEAAVELARDLVDRHGDPHAPRLANALVVLGVALRNLDDPEDAVTRIDEAVAIYRRLLVTLPSATMAELANALQHLGDALSDLDDAVAARDAYAESVDIYRKLADPRPETNEPELADVLRRLANALHDLGELIDAQAAADEAADLLAARVARGEHGLRLNLARAHLVRALILLDLDENDRAVGVAEDAVALYTALIDAGEQADEVPLGRADALHLAGKALDAAGRHREAVARYRTAVEHLREVPLEGSHAGALAEATHDLAVCLSTLDRPEDALPHFTEAVRLRRDLLDGTPDAALELAVARYNQADCLRDLDRDDDARAPAAEARRLAADLHRAGHGDAAELYVHTLRDHAVEVGADDLPAAVAALAEALAVARGTDSEDDSEDDIAGTIVDTLADLADGRRAEVRRIWETCGPLPCPLP